MPAGPKQQSPVRAPRWKRQSEDQLDVSDTRPQQVLPMTKNLSCDPFISSRIINSPLFSFSLIVLLAVAATRVSKRAETQAAKPEIEPCPLSSAPERRTLSNDLKSVPSPPQVPASHPLSCPAPSSSFFIALAIFYTLLHTLAYFCIILPAPHRPPQLVALFVFAFVESKQIRSYMYV